MFARSAARGAAGTDADGAGPLGAGIPESSGRQPARLRTIASDSNGFRTGGRQCFGWVVAKIGLE